MEFEHELSREHFWAVLVIEVDADPAEPETGYNGTWTIDSAIIKGTDVDMAGWLKKDSARQREIYEAWEDWIKEQNEL